MIMQPYAPDAPHALFLYPIALSSVLLIIEWPRRTEPHGLAIGHYPPWLRWAIYALLGLIILTVGSVESREFVYFQF